MNRTRESRRVRETHTGEFISTDGWFVEVSTGEVRSSGGYGNFNGNVVKITLHLGSLTNQLKKIYQ